ncbi:FHA domain-containing protein [Eubacteriales bacterium OttesenSCG-928-A19]|nr:FHA domain-containing protein [Eubacteriales bacterium OttesenSCG-928-A19]
MNESVYSVVAYIARYWFALLALVIVWRAIVWLRQDAHRVARAKRKLPDAGFIGEWAVVASGTPEIEVGTLLRAPRDGWIGSARACDVRLRDERVPARAARFFLREDGLHLQPSRGGGIEVDGEPVQHEAVLRHGAMLAIGGITLQLRLFAGILLEGESPAAPSVDRKGRLQTMEVPEEDEQAHVRTELPKPALVIPAGRMRKEFIKRRS